MRGFAGAGVGVALLAAACLVVPEAAFGASTTWQVRQSPDVTVPYGQVQAVACPSSSSCVAVGTYRNSRGLTALLAERWSGTSWQQETMPAQPDASLNGVSCYQTSFCVAVGELTSDAFGIIETWNGTSWSSQFFSPPAGATSMEFRAVSCVSSTFCEAVGEYTSAGLVRSLAYEWNGSAWSLQSSPNQGTVPTRLDGVSCVSTHFCQAVDFYGAIVEQWNGTRWTARTVPLPTGMRSPSLNAVSCTSTSMCEAVGSYFNPNGTNALTLYAEHWNGSGWQEQPVNNTLNWKVFTGVSCASATSCQAVGYREIYVSGIDTFRPIAEQWNGSGWAGKTVASAGGTTVTMLNGVSCAGTTCEAGGSFPIGMESWNGTSWVKQASVLPPGAINNTLTDVSCASATSCEAVGYTAGVPTGLEEGWNGTSWRIQTRLSSLPMFSSVSCASTTFCAAVGTTSTGTAAAMWNGTSWVSQSTPPQASASYSSVSCPTTTFCVAVGPSGAITWNGASWSGVALPQMNAAYTSVSCASATSCEAVGPLSGGSATFAAGWNGSAWTAQTVPSPAGAKVVELRTVSCPVAGACEAIGESNLGVYSVAWDGTSWAMQASVPLPSGSVSETVSELSCTSASECTLVGHASNGQALAEAWDGTSWSIQPAVSPATTSNYLSGVSCLAGGGCVAVGSYPDAGGYATTLVETSG